MARLKFRKYRVTEKAFVVGAHAFLVLFAAVCAFPFLNVLAKSFSPEFYIQQGQVWLWPVKVTLNGYEKIFEAQGIVLGFRNSLVVGIVGTAVNLAHERPHRLPALAQAPPAAPRASSPSSSSRCSSPRASSRCTSS